MNQSDWISLGALVVALLAVLYARWSAMEAKKANKISLHFQKVEIYEEVMTFSDCFRGIFSVPTEQRLEQFRKEGVNRAEIYFSEEVHRQLQEIYSHCNDSEVWLRLAQDKDQNDIDVPTELTVRAEYKSVLNLLYPVIQLMKNELKLNA